jgi:5-methylcytosine-specific restriction endonuclease McrA
MFMVTIEALGVKIFIYRYGWYKMKFIYKEDEIYFKSLLQDVNEEAFTSLFDCSSPLEKRKAFDKNKKAIFDRLNDIQSAVCLLGFKGVCDRTKGIEIDHIIPLSSNSLNKALRHMKAVEKGRKVKSESYGSNDMNNLILVCKPCNQHKKHRLLNKEVYQEIFRKKGLL